MTTPPPAPEIPDAYARYLRATFPPELADGLPGEIAGRWRYMTSARERRFWGGVDAALAAAAAVPPAPSPVLDKALHARELFADAVTAGQAYDCQFRPRGRNWGRVSGEQAARIVEGALLHLRKTARPDPAHQPETITEERTP